MPLDGHNTMHPLPTLPDLIAEARESSHSDEAIAAALEDNPDTEWGTGLPPGDYYPGMENDYEVSYSPIA